MTAELISRGDVLRAAELLRGRVLRTPVVSRVSFNRWFGCDVHFKCENFQRTGSFKYRGATHAVARLRDPTVGVATHSSGNHGAALALAAREAGVPAHIVVPADASPVKREAIVAYGGRIVECGATLADRESALAAVCAETGAAFVPPYDHPHVIAGQGTAALELAESVPELSELWVPVGGGGLAAGSLLALAGSGVVVRGVEPELADDGYWSLRTGLRQPPKPPMTVADGLRTALGELPFELFRQHALDIRRVSEAEILSAQQLVWQRLKLVVEPSAVVPLAGLRNAVREDPEGYRERRVGVVLSGGNVTFASG
jgi:threonine dehydratase